MKRETISRVFSHMPVLETERLILRRILPVDVSDMYAYASDRELCRYLTWDPHSSEEYTRSYLAYLESRYAIGDFFDFAVVEKKSGRMIGTCGFTRFRCEDDCGEIGYVLSRDCWGHGYAPEAANAVIDFGFDVLHLERIEAKFIKGNENSFRVMQKLGFRFEGFMRNAMRIKGKMCTIGICSLLRGEPRLGAEGEPEPDQNS